MRPGGMQVQMTAYDVLGVIQSASNDEIKLAFKRIAQIYHPDKRKRVEGWDDPWPKRVLAMATSAKDMLLDPEKRAAYDLYLQHGRSPQPVAAAVDSGREGPEILPRNPPPGTTPRVNPLVAALQHMSHVIDPGIFVDFTAEQIKAWLDRNTNKKPGA